MVTLDCLGESVHEAAAAEAACDTYLQLLDRLAAEKLDSHVSVKLTQLGLAIDEGLARRNLARLAESAARHHNFVRVDMEGSAFTDATLRVFCSVGAPRDVVGIAIQSYLRPHAVGRGGTLAARSAHPASERRLQGTCGCRFPQKERSGRAVPKAYGKAPFQRDLPRHRDPRRAPDRGHGALCARARHLGPRISNSNCFTASAGNSSGRSSSKGGGCACTFPTGGSGMLTLCAGSRSGPPICFS